MTVAVPALFFIGFLLLVVSNQYKVEQSVAKPKPFYKFSSAIFNKRVRETYTRKGILLQSLALVILSASLLLTIYSVLTKANMI